MNKNDPAFPCMVNVGKDATCEAEANESVTFDGKIYDQIYCSGLTKRELLAGMAMQGLLANPNTEDLGFDEIKSDAYGFADEMLREG